MLAIEYATMVLPMTGKVLVAPTLHIVLLRAYVYGIRAKKWTFNFQVCLSIVELAAVLPECIYMLSTLYLDLHTASVDNVNRIFRACYPCMWSGVALDITKSYCQQ